MRFERTGTNQTNDLGRCPISPQWISGYAGGLPSAPAGDRNQCSAGWGRHACQVKGPSHCVRISSTKIKTTTKRLGTRLSTIV